MTPHYLRHVTKPLNFPLLLSHLKDSVYLRTSDAEIECLRSLEPLTFGQIQTQRFEPLALGVPWGGVFDCAWFRLRGEVPGETQGKTAVLVADINGEGCVYGSSGNAVIGITCGSSVFDRTLGNPEKRIVPLGGLAREGRIELYIDGANNDLFGNFQAKNGVQCAYFALCDEDKKALYYDCKTLWDMLNALEEKSARYQQILGVLNRVQNTLSLDFSGEEVKKARDITHRALSMAGGDAPLRVYAVGHAHLDLAWLWPLRETRRKFIRTLSTQLQLLKKYKDYIFQISQPQLLEWLREDNAELYKKTIEQIKDGRIEMGSATWVENDTYMPSGESLVRQFIYGAGAAKQILGRACDVLWLPDAFGFSAALPQIASKCGIKYFSTIKLSWSAYDPFPFSSFRWIGSDGSSLLAHMPPELTYNGAGSPRALKQIEENNLETAVFDSALMLFGIGDGAGGPGEEHLETLTRLKNTYGFCPVTLSKTDAFYAALDRAQKDLPSYRGELYVQNHQGTLTSVAEVKKYNRLLEGLLRHAELLCSLASIKKHAAYPKSELDKIWKEVLLYQFHDILPGSCIRRVYTECIARYKILEREVRALIETAHGALVCGEGTTVYNFSPYPNILYDDVAARTLRPLSNIGERAAKSGELYADGDVLENKFVKVTFGSDGAVTSFFDKELETQAVKTGGVFNRLAVYNDLGDAWDMSIAYSSGVQEQFILKKVSTQCVGGKAVRTAVYTYRESTLTQQSVLYADSRALEFDTELDWRQRDKMLRTCFDVNLTAREVECDMQFGGYSRAIGSNTTEEFSRFEVCAHKFAALSEGGVSVALFNDCKYGYGATKDSLSLNLVRCKAYPNDYFDLGVHRFTYAVGCFTQNSTQIAEAAYALNNPPAVMQGSTPELFAAKTDNDGIVIETLKQSEDGTGFILRLYESLGKRSAAVVTTGFSFASATETDMLENPLRALESRENGISLEFAPREVKTIKFIGVT